jgi:hypothetical protein
MTRTIISTAFIAAVGVLLPVILSPRPALSRGRGLSCGPWPPGSSLWIAGSA